MGLFGKPKPQPCNTIEEFLQQEPTSVLKQIAFLSIEIYSNYEGETTNFYSPLMNLSANVKLKSNYYFSDHFEAKDYTAFFTHKLPSKFKGLNGFTLSRTILEIVEQRGDASNIAFFLGVDKEFGLFNLAHEVDPSVADYHYKLARDQGCKLLPLLDYLRECPYSHEVYKDRKEFILTQLYNQIQSNIDEDAHSLTKKFTSDDWDILKKITTLGTIMCQEMGYPFSTLLTFFYIKKRSHGSSDPMFDDSFNIYGCSAEEQLSLAVKVWLQAQNGDALAKKACEMCRVAF